MTALRVSFYLKKRNLCVRLSGYLDQETVKDLRTKLIEIIDTNNVLNIVFNMKEVEFMDSTGVGVIIGRYNQIKFKGGKIVICEMNKNIERIIFLTGLARICSLKENEASAINYLECV